MINVFLGDTNSLHNIRESLLICNQSLENVSSIQVLLGFAYLKILHIEGEFLLQDRDYGQRGSLQLILHTDNSFWSNDGLDCGLYILCHDITCARAFVRFGLITRFTREN